MEVKQLIFYTSLATYALSLYDNVHLLFWNDLVLKTSKEGKERG